MSFFTELKRRNIFKVGMAYAIVAWLLIQVASVLFPTFTAPQWVMQVFTVVVILGFPIALILAWAYELTPEGIKPTQSVAPLESITQITGQRLNYTLIVLLSLALIFLVIDNYVLNKSPVVTREPAITPVDAEIAVPATVKIEEVKPEVSTNSIAVLPFTNLSPDSDQEYFADGLTEELLNKLSQVKDLQVTGRTSSFYFKGKNEDLRTIGEMLGVAHLLEGSVRKDGEQIRITTQLVKAADGYHLWSETYDRKLSGIFAIQDEIARAVTTALSVTLGAGEFNRPGMTRNTEAYEAYLQGMARRNQNTPESYLAAIEYFEEAVRLDANFALGWVRLVDLYGGPEITVLTPQESVGFKEKADFALERAQAVAPDMPEVLAATASSQLFTGDRLEVEQIYQRLIKDYAYSNALINRNYGLFLLLNGRTREALTILQRAVRIDPLDGVNYNAITVELLISNTGGDTDTLNIYEWLTALIEGKFALAGQKMAEGYDLQGDNPNETMLAIAELLKSANKNAVITEIRTAAADQNTSVIIWDNLARIAAALGEMQLALDMFSEGKGSTFPFWEPQSKQLRQSPEFKSLVRENGQLAYWRTTGHWPDVCHPIGEDDFECE